MWQVGTEGAIAPPVGRTVLFVSLTTLNFIYSRYCPLLTEKTIKALIFKRVI